MTFFFGGESVGAGTPIVGGGGVANTPTYSSTRLGCGVAEVFVTERGGAPLVLEAGWQFHTLVGQMLYTDLKYNRPLSDTGQCELVLDGVSGVVGGAACCRMLLDVEPWEHELVVLRDGAVSFQGPIVQIVFSADKVTIRARDVSAWFDKRAVHENLGPYNVTAPTLVDASAIMLAAARSALAPDTSPQIGGLSGASTPSGSYPAGYAILAAEDHNAGQAIRELARLGPDWIVKPSDRTMYAGYTGARLVHIGDKYGFQNPLAGGDTSTWSASDGTLAMTTLAGTPVMSWTITTNGIHTLSTTLRNLKPGRPHNFLLSVQTNSAALPPVTSAHGILGFNEQGPDYTVALAMPANPNTTIVQVAGTPDDDENDYTFHLETSGPVTLYFNAATAEEYLPVMVLNDEAFASPPDVVFDGLQQVNRQIIHGSGEGPSGAGIRGEAPLPVFPVAAPWPTLTAEQQQYGLLEDVEQEQSILDTPTANRAALSRYLLLFRAPRVIAGGKLSTSAQFAGATAQPWQAATQPPTVQFSVADLLPGNYVFVQLDRYCIPVGDYFRIANVEFSYPGGSEEIALTLIPPRDL